MITESTRDWCKMSYPNHPKGCPNYNKNELCPPKCKLLHQIFDSTKPLYLAITIFDLEGHVARLRRVHPDWSDRQLICCLYWQSRVRSKQKDDVRIFMLSSGCTEWTDRPEAMGLNVIYTLNKLDIPIRPQIGSRVYKVAMVGHTKSHKILEEYD